MLSQLAMLFNAKVWIWKNEEPEGYASVDIEPWAHIIPQLCLALHTQKRNYAQNRPCISDMHAVLPVHRSSWRRSEQGHMEKFTPRVL